MASSAPVQRRRRADGARGGRLFGLAALCAALVALPLVGCALADFAGQPLGETCSPITRSFVIEPTRWQRGAAAELVLTWQIEPGVVAPTATLYVGVDDAVAVTLPLTPTAEGLYGGRLVNPFGPGAPAGEGWILGDAGLPAGCLARAEASATFVLQ